jgi:hypothetical protein
MLICFYFFNLKGEGWFRHEVIFFKMFAFKNFVWCFLFCLFSFSFSNLGFAANTRFGASFAPGISICKSSNKFNLESVGVVVEHYFTDNVSLGSGAMYGWKSLYSGSHFKLGYFQVPVLAKLHTNEIALDLRLGFATGFVLSFKVEEEEIDKDLLTKKFKVFDLPFYFGLGAEYDIAAFSTLFCNFFWKKGIISTLVGSDSSLKTNFIGLDIGVKV